MRAAYAASLRSMVDCTTLFGSTATTSPAKRTRRWDPPTCAPTASTATPPARRPLRRAAPRAKARRSASGGPPAGLDIREVVGTRSPSWRHRSSVATRSIRHGEVLEHVTTRADGSGGQVRGPSHETEPPPPRPPRPLEYCAIHRRTSVPLRSSHCAPEGTPSDTTRRIVGVLVAEWMEGAARIRVSVQACRGWSRPTPHRVGQPDRSFGSVRCAGPFVPVVRRGRVRVYGDPSPGGVAEWLRQGPAKPCHAGSIPAATSMMSGTAVDPATTSSSVRRYPRSSRAHRAPTCTGAKAGLGRLRPQSDVDVLVVCQAPLAE